jgi:two-component system, OmpR family, sensor histidine kinase TctE
MRPINSTLRRTLLVWLLAPLFVLLILETLVTYSTSVTFADEAYDRSLREIAREVLLQVRNDGGRPKLEMPSTTERVLLGDQDDQLFYKVAAADGSLIAGDQTIPPPPRGLELAPHIDEVFYNGDLRGTPVRIVAANMLLDAFPSTLMTVQIAETLNKRHRLATDIRVNALIPQVLLIILAVIAVYYGVQQGLFPLQILRRAISNRSHLDMSPIDAAHVPGEVKPLVEEINNLLARLGTTVDFQNRFIADAAHQLKTPVAGIKAQAELALRETEQENLRRTVAHLYSSADRLSRLVNQLLLLARNEPGAVKAVNLLPMDLNALALEVTMEWVPEALRRNVDLGFESARASVIIDGDAHRLRELINNLVDNAVRYSQDKGRVTVRVVNGEQRILSVSDDGPRIPVEERKAIFQRFHRLLGTHADGSGLGLAIVSEIAALHKASITLEEDMDGVGNTFTVFFPPPRTQSGDGN